MRTLFEYGSRLNSRDLNLALASLVGVGPICGFNRVNIEGNTMNILSPELSDTSGIYKHVLWDKVNSRFINQLEDGGNTQRILHGCIARDGSLYLDGNSSIVVNIQNYKGLLNEVLLFAQHTSVSDPIDNPVNLVAYYNTTTNSFYQDFYKPVMTGDLTLLYDNSHTSKINFKKLENKAFSSIPQGNISINNSVLVGIYGTGVNQDTGLVEDFVIVPYHSQYPTSIDYNILIHQYLMNLGNRVSRLEGK